MKIRTDFVTNSSSASFTTYTVRDARLMEFLVKLTQSDDLYIDSPEAAGGCETGFWYSSEDGELTIQDYDSDSDWEPLDSEYYMGSLYDAIVFYLRKEGYDAIDIQENLDRLEFLVDEAWDNDNCSSHSFIADSD